MRSFAISLVVAFVVLSALADSGATERRVAGTVVEFKAGEWIAITNAMFDPGGFRLALRGTEFEGNPADLKPGAVVTVWYRSLAERRPVADRVRVNPPNLPNPPNPPNL